MTAAQVMAVKGYLAKSSPQFQKAFAGVARLVRSSFPKARSTFQWKMPGWAVPVKKSLIPADYRGTMEPDSFVLLMVERKQGITFHMLNPIDYHFMDLHRAALAKVGLKAMRGCLQFNRKSEYPVAAIKPVFRSLKKSAA